MPEKVNLLHVSVHFTEGIVSEGHGPCHFFFICDPQPFHSEPLVIRPCQAKLAPMSLLPVSLRCIETSADVVFPLRHGVLRAGRPLAEAQFAGDDMARHFAIIDDSGACVCCLTMIQVAYDGDSQFSEMVARASAWQLRGMATAESHRGMGLGKKLLYFMEETLFSDSSGSRDSLLWCNARELVVGFYVSCGWVVDSDMFELQGGENMPTIGMHYRMIKNVGVIK